MTVLKTLGVIANPTDYDAVAEFFELFKTPWEFHVPGRSYDVLLCAADPAKVGPFSTKLLIVYAGRKVSFDKQEGIEVEREKLGSRVVFEEMTIPLHGTSVRFTGAHKNCVVRRKESGVIRVSYDLFQETKFLLTRGQHPANASVPALDLHIGLLRRLITGSGFSIVEVPPVPGGFSFIACLTHDLDHASIRRHKFDATMFGFLYRATFGSLMRVVRRRMSPRKALQNWIAAFKLPLVHLGLVDDFWSGFDRYVELENGRPSTFFVIPFAGIAGQAKDGKSSATRASAYDVSHISEKVLDLNAAGCEIGLHGIDAWTDRERATQEAERISEASGTPTRGVRMHWLYQDQRTPNVLEESGFSYDSTVGYNDAVGYRAGTSQAFKPLQAMRLLELPLHIMDTALFFPDRMGLSEDEAWVRVTALLEHAKHNGGVLTINWHDRSIAPERLWGDFYVRLVQTLTSSGALFLTASDAASWVRRRRSVVFEDAGNGRGCATAPSDNGVQTVGMRLRVHRPGDFSEAGESYTDTIFMDVAPFEYETEDSGMPVQGAMNG